MGRPRSVSTAATAAASDPLPLDSYDDGVSWAVTIDGGGDRTYAVQFTIQDIHQTSAGGVSWFDAVSAKTAADAGYLDFAVTGIRVVSTQGSGAATLTLHALQKRT